MEFPKTCCKNAAKGDEPFRSCGKPAAHWFLHDEDICSYCDEHKYTCGIPLAEGAVMNRSDFIKKYKGKNWKAPIEEFVRQAPEFRGEETLAKLIGILMADIEFAIKFPE